MVYINRSQQNTQVHTRNTIGHWGRAARDYSRLCRHSLQWLDCTRCSFLMKYATQFAGKTQSKQIILQTFKCVTQLRGDEARQKEFTFCIRLGAIHIRKVIWLLYQIFLLMWPEMATVSGSNRAHLLITQAPNTAPDWQRVGFFCRVDCLRACFCKLVFVGDCFRLGFTSA